MSGSVSIDGGTSAITDAQLSRDKITFAGVGKGGPDDIFMFHGIKQ